MLITGVSIEGAGRFNRVATIRGLGAGVNVLAAGNEAGKSTMFKAIRTCLFKRHNSKDQDISDLAHMDGQLPLSVTVAFELGGNSYEVRKSFLRSPAATLSENGREIARGRVADEKVWELFGIEAGSGRTIDDGAFGLLWVGQGKSMAVPDVKGRAESVLSSIIDAEVGNLVGGERARAVLSAMNAELQKSFTEKDRTKTGGPLGAAEDQLVALREECSALAERKALLERQFVDLYALRNERTQLTDPVERARIASDFQEAEKALTVGQAAVTALQAQLGTERAAHAKFETAEQRIANFGDLVARIDAARQREKELAQAIPLLSSREQEARDRVEHTKSLVAGLDDELNVIEQRVSLMQQIAMAASSMKGKDDAVRKVKGLEDAAARLAAVEAQLSPIKVTPATFKVIEGIQNKLATLEARLAAASAQMAIEIHGSEPGLVKLDDQAMSGRHSGPVLRRTRVEIAGLATITVTPAQADSEASEQERRELDAQMQESLRKVAATSAAEAASQLTARRNLEAQRQGVRAELAALGAADYDAAKLIKALKDSIANADAAVNHVLAQATMETFPTDDVIAANQAGLRDLREQKLAERARLGGSRNVDDQLLEEAIRARGGPEAELVMLRGRLDVDLKICPDEERGAKQEQLAKLVDEARTAHQQAAGALAELTRQAPDQDELDRRAIRVRRLKEQAQNHTKRLTELEGQIGALEAHIQHAGGEGLGEQLASKQEQLEMAERHHASVVARLSALRLLHKTVSDCLAEGQERYLAPVRRHLRPFLNDLFPGAELQMGEKFQIAGIKRDIPEDFGRLSDGTQEQIAVLVRLAMGAMLAERSQPVPIVLDDALVFSDDDRIQRMFDALSRAGEQHQVIILTCRTKTFGQLGGRPLRIEYDGG